LWLNETREREGTTGEGKEVVTYASPIGERNVNNGNKRRTVSVVA